jgi:hypothetical protein
MPGDRCGETRGGLVCDRSPGHAGDHRGYLETIDENLFWPSDVERLAALQGEIVEVLARLEGSGSREGRRAARELISRVRPFAS